MGSRYFVAACGRAQNHRLFLKRRSNGLRAFRAVGGNPFFAVRASRATVWDADGNEYIDYVGTWGPAILGHAPEVVVEAVQKAA